MSRARLGGPACNVICGVMTRILLVETASPSRVRKKAQEFLARGPGTDTDITILCCDDLKTIQYFSNVSGVRVIALRRHGERAILNDLNKNYFDIVHTFWTGEKKYRRMKLLALRLRAKLTRVDIGDGGEFRLTWKAFIRHSLFRWKHPLPTDHWEFVPPENAPVTEEYYEGERILIIQSADPVYVLRALEVLRERRLFRSPRYTIFCRNQPEIVRHFKGHPLIHNILIHSETRDSWKHMRDLRRERFDAVVVLFTGDHSYWKIKYFAFLLGARHKLIFNESLDCFFFSLNGWLALMSHRLGEQSRREIRPRWAYSTRFALFLSLKCVIFPFRFLWLLLVWLRLRFEGFRISD